MPIRPLSLLPFPYLFLLFGQLDPLDQQSKLNFDHLFLKIGFYIKGGLMAPHLRFEREGERR